VTTWIVLLEDRQAAYGPFGDRAEADLFAEYLRNEVDPATVHELKSPSRELLAWRATVRAQLRSTS
jgi:hypothetical protein